jgi:hypothetical protein
MKTPRGMPFQAGRSGNPGGRPKTAEISALARRYVVDAVRGLVAVARLDPAKHDTAVRAACDSLIDLGYPGARRPGPGEGDAVNVLHLHLLAVQEAAAVGLPLELPVRPIEPPIDGLGEPIEPPIDAETEALIDQGLLPEGEQDLPDTALPLWDAATGRRRYDA